jgi:AbiJ N-terminal domain 4
MMAGRKPNMATFNLFSKRRKRAAGDMPDVYTYDIPINLRVQITHIWNDAIGNPGREYDPAGRISDTYLQIVDALRREYGVYTLHKDTRNPNDAYQACEELGKFFLDPGGFVNTNSTDKALDVIEFTFRIIDRVTRKFDYLQRFNASEIADEAIEELNARFKEHSVGYFYSDGTIGRVDSELVHAEVVKPALVVLRQKSFASAQSEFLAAHEHYRVGKNSEALVECYKAFESTMKIICTNRKWAFDKTKGAADLVRVCLDNGLIPAYWQSYFGGLRSVLESAIPTPRNRQAGHGAGVQPVQKPPDELIAYILHVTAATILFLTEAERKLS